MSGLERLYSGRGKSAGFQGPALSIANTLLEGESLAGVVRSERAG